MINVHITLISQQSTIVLYRYLAVFTPGGFRYVYEGSLFKDMASTVQTVNSPQVQRTGEWIGVTFSMCVIYLFLEGTVSAGFSTLQSSKGC